MDLMLPPPAEPNADDATVDDGGAGEVAGPVGRRPPQVDGGLLGGVAAHLGRQIGVDPLWIRIAFVLLTLTGGIGIALYLGLWLALVLAPTMGWGVVGGIGGAILVVGIPWLLVFGSRSVISGWPAVVLLLGGLALSLWQPRHRMTPAPVRARSAGTREGPPTVVGAAPAADPKPPRTRRQPSVLGRAALGLAIVVAAVGALVDDANGGRLHPEQWLGAAALVCGLGVLVGTVVGRARWLVLPAAAFAVAGFGAGELAAMGIGVGDAFGDDWVSVRDGVPTTQSVETGVGDVYVQLDQFDGPLDREYRVDTRAAIGTVYVSVGSIDTEVVVVSRTDHGRTLLDGESVDDTLTLNPGAGGDGRLVVDAWVGVGDVVVYQSYAADFGPSATVVPAPPDVVSAVEGSLVQIDQYVGGTADGWIVLANGEAVLDPDDRVVFGQTYDDGDPSVDGDFDDGSVDDGSVSIVTGYGEFRLLPRSLLLTPDGRVVDLRAVRQSLAATTSATATTSPTTFVPGPDSSAPAPPADALVPVPTVTNGEQP